MDVVLGVMQVMGLSGPELDGDQTRPACPKAQGAACATVCSKVQDGVAVDAAPAVLLVRDPLAGVSVSAVPIISPQRRRQGLRLTSAVVTGSVASASHCCC